MTKNSSVMSIQTGGFGENFKESENNERKNMINGLLEVRVKIMKTAEFKTSRKLTISKAA